MVGKRLYNAMFKRMMNIKLYKSFPDLVGAIEMYHKLLIPAAVKVFKSEISTFKELILGKTDCLTAQNIGDDIISQI